MENNEIMNNIEEVAEMNDVAVVGKSNGVRLVEAGAIAVGVVVAGVAIYKAARWVTRKIKAKKDAKAAADECIEATYEECAENVEA